MGEAVSPQEFREHSAFAHTDELGLLLNRWREGSVAKRNLLLHAGLVEHVCFRVSQLSASRAAGTESDVAAANAELQAAIRVLLAVCTSSEAAQANVQNDCWRRDVINALLDAWGTCAAADDDALHGAALGAIEPLLSEDRWQDEALHRGVLRLYAACSSSPDLIIAQARTHVLAFSWS